jgi:hypothetical protein
LFYGGPPSLDDVFPASFSDSELPVAIKATENLNPGDESIFNIGTSFDSTLNLSSETFPGSHPGGKLNIMIPTPDPEPGYNPGVTMDTPLSNLEYLSPSKSMGVFQKLPLE